MRIDEYFEACYQRMTDEVERLDMDPNVTPAYLCWSLIRVYQELGYSKLDFYQMCEKLKREYENDYTTGLYSKD